MKYSVFALAKQAFSHHEKWPEQWASPDPKPAYDVVIIGGGGHGLATAYYLAKEHGITNVAIIEKGWLGGGNTGRNTTIVRSNYLLDESSLLYDKSLKLFEGLSKDINYNIMLSQRGVISLAHTLGEVREAKRRVNANNLNGIDGDFITPDQIKELCPIINISEQSRYPIMGATYQKRAGVARHDAVAWGLARAASARGVDIIQNCEVTGINYTTGGVSSIETSRGTIGAKKIAICTAGHSSVVAAMAGLRLPVTSHPLQALVSEPIKPIHPNVIMSNAVHVYVSQSDKGELVMGAGIDSFNSYAQRGSFHIIEHQINALIEMFPIFSRLKMMRSWGGIVDTCPDASPIISKTPISGLYINGGWGTGGFKATPGAGFVFAHTIAKDEPHPLNAAFSLDRFTSGHLIDEHGAAGVAH